MTRSRRTLKDVKRTWSPEEIYELITGDTWPYKTWMSHYHCRDRALLSLLYLTAGRVSEVLSLRKKQFDLEEDPDVVVIKNMLTEKIGEASSCLPYRETFPLPKQGPLAPFTELVLEYLERLKHPEQKLFPFSRQRAWQIVEHITGKWPHWYRAQGERLWGKLLKDIIELRDLVNVADIRTLAKYVKTDWRESKEKFLGS